MDNRRRWELTGRIFMCLWVLFTLPTVLQLVAAATAATFAVAAGFAVWAAVWIWLWLRALGKRHAGEVIAFATITLILTEFAFIAPMPIGAGGVLVFAFIVAGVIFAWRSAVWAIAGLSVLQVFMGSIRLEDPAMQVSSLLNSILVGCVGIGVRLLWTSYAELTEAREEIARLAVNEERLRFARDVHDLLGQSLATIVLKTELIGRQLPADADDSMKHELDDVVTVARKSLKDLREAVTGYRRPTLPDEISSARAALRSAGIKFAVEDRLGTVAVEKDEVLAWCVREAVTNVVKHSGATRCTVSLARDNGLVRLSIEDDGSGASSLDGGSGLAGLRERVTMVGGTIEVAGGTGAPDHGVTVRVAIPA